MQRRVEIVVGLSAVAAILAVAARWPRETPVAATSIERTRPYQDPQHLARAWSLPVAHLYGPQSYVFKPNQSLCGPTSIADLRRSEGFHVEPGEIVEHAGIMTIFGLLPAGVTLDQEATMLAQQTGKPVKTLRGLSLADFRAEMARGNDPAVRLIVNFTRLELFGRGHGHFSPILGYLNDEDLVFVGDVNARYRPWLVPTARLYDAQNTLDPASGAKRGVLEVRAD